MSHESSLTGGQAGTLSVPGSFAELLDRRAQEQPEAMAYTFLRDGEEVEVSWTYAALQERVRAIAAQFQAADLVGKRALLLYPPGLEFVEAFVACLYAGVVAVPAYPPGSKRSLPRLEALLEDAQPAAVLSASSLAPRLQARRSGLDRLPWRITDLVDGAEALSWQAPDKPAAGEPAFLQYTSGSTSAPKGVMVGEANLLYNEAMIQRAFEQSERSVIVSWLPLYHDMGLIGGVLQPLFVGAHCILMAPVAFLQRPVRWLRAIERFRGSTSGGPNFAYDLCCQRISAEECRDLDLSSWQVAFNGAEPVRAATLERFATTFAPCGFDRRALFPCYGMAEVTLFATGGAVADAPRCLDVDGGEIERDRVLEVAADAPTRQRLVGSGGVPAGTEVVVVEAETRRLCSPDQVGEIWIAGPHVAGGYWGNPDATARDFGARLEGDPQRGPFLRTGDLGFLNRGELFVTGRLKDLIIIRGRNLYPQDIELVAEGAHPELSPAGGAAFGVMDGGEERLVVVHEAVRRPKAALEDIADAIRTAVAEEVEVQVQAVVLVGPGGVPKTSSGKVQRGACRARYLAGTLRTREVSELTAEAADVLDAADATPWPTAAELAGASGGEWLETALRQRLAARLRLRPEQISRQRPLTALGLDSLSAIELSNELAEHLGTEVSLSDLLMGCSLEGLAAAVFEGLGTAVDTGLDAAPAPSASPSEPFPLSHGQRALWFMERLAPTGGAYNIAAAADVRPAVEAEALECALEDLVRRHGALRTTFSEGEEGPLQCVGETARLDFVTVDAAGWTPEELDGWLAEEAWRPFDLERDPLLRVRLAQLAGERSVLLLVVHHLVADFASLAVLVGQLRELYRPGGEVPAGAAGAAAAEAEAGMRDVVEFERRLLRSERGEELWRFWADALAEAPFTLELPLDRPRPAVQTTRGGAVSQLLDLEFDGRLRRLAGDLGATPYVVLLAAFGIFLERLSGRQDLLVGSPFAGRTQAALGRLVGYLVHPLPLRLQLGGEPSFKELVGELRTHVVAALEHQEMPLSLLVERLQPERDAARSPLFQVLFVLQRVALKEAEDLAAFALPGSGAGGSARLGPLTLTPRPLTERRAQFDLALQVAQGGDGLALCFEYNTDLFDATTVGRWLRQLETVLRTAVAEPGRGVATLPLQSAAERQQLLEWNDSVADGMEVPLLRAFESWVERTPKAVAVSFEGQGLSYGDLDQRANRLAHHLRAQGVGHEARVAVCLERSLDLVVALVAVFKASAAYVPMDPDDPAERLRGLLEDAQPTAVLSCRDVLRSGLRQALAELLAEVEGQTLVLADQDAEAIASCSAEPLADLTGGESLAYVMFTSGSTGRPKGAMNRQRSIANRLHWMQAAYGLGPGDRVLQKTPFTFDVSVWEFFWPLMTGAHLVVARPRGHQDVAYLARTVAAEKITTMHFVPSVLEVFLEQDLSACTDLVRVIASGEALAADLARRFAERLPGVQLHNLYGPTEAAVDVTFQEAHNLPEQAAVVPIGRAIANTSIQLLDRRGRVVPLGAPGELYIGGVSLARGYAGRPALTAERFRPAGNSAEPGERLYATGDLARCSTAGTVLYLGRIDHQVKIRGVRIELGEIESVLMRHPEVLQAVVTVCSGTAGDRLVAYVVATSSAPPADGLRAFLAQHLSEALVPSTFVALEELPRTASGKINRGALPAPPDEGSGATFRAPRNPVEALLVAVWSELLGVDRVLIEDDFFALGGHSLLASRLISRVRGALGVEPPLSDLFEYPTLAAFAGRVERCVERSAGANLPALVPRAGSSEEEIPLSFAQQRLWFLHRLEPASAAYSVPAVVALHGRLDFSALVQALVQQIKRHEALRTTFPERDGRAFQRIADAPGRPLLTLPRIDLGGLADAAAEAERLATLWGRRPFDLECGPLLRLALLRLAADHHVLLLTLHHIVADGWSLNVLEDDLVESYEAALASRPAALPDLPVQYADWALWQHQVLAGPRMDALLDFWKGLLTPLPPVLELPLDRPRPALPKDRGGRQSLALSAALRRRLERVGQGSGGTLFMTLLAAFQCFLGRLSGQPRLAVGTPVANRTQREIEPLMGCFVNTLVLPVDLSGGLDFAGLLERVREVAIGAYVHQELPFERLVDALQPERDLAVAPLFQTLFVLQEEAPRASALESPGPRLERPRPGAPGWTPAGGAQQRETPPASPTPPADCAPSSESIQGRLAEGVPAGVLEWHRQESPIGTVKFDLVLELSPSGGGLDGFLSYRAELFDGTTAARLAGHLEALLEAVAAQPERRLEELPWLTSAQRQQLLAEWNDTAQVLAGPSLVHGLVARQVARSPQAPALVLDEGTWSYERLAAAVAALTPRLRAAGVGPEVVVGVCLPTTLELPAVLLAVLTAGGAYLALDPELPQERLAFLLADAGAELVVTRGSVAQRFAELPVQCLGWEGVLGDEGSSGTDFVETAFPEAAVDPDNLAYLIYTSGSTGQPKAVAVSHRAISNRLLEEQSGLVLRAGDRVLQLASPSFDFSVWELFGPLVVGACVVLLSSTARRDSAAVAEVTARQKVTHLHFVPSALQVFLEQEGLAACSSLRILLSGGEVLSKMLLRRVAERLPGVRLINQYGPTETTVDVCWWQEGSLESSVPIGRPFDNVRLHVVDPELRPVAIGVVGELAVAGVQLARGYLGRVALTAAQFVPDPLADTAGGRLYLTGDRVRWLASGQLEYLGRWDHQVKVRGFRIELEEIEALLAQHPGVAAAAAAVKAGPAGDRLLAYVVGSDVPGEEELRQFLAQRVPEFMLPARFIELEALPRSAAGKLDRGALPEPERARPALASHFLAPRNAEEATLAAVWREVLGLDAVGVDDNFFELGGDSIVGIQVVSRVAQAGLRITPRQIFEHQTIAGLSAVAVPVVATDEEVGPAEGPVHLTPIQHDFLSRRLPQPNHFNQALMLEVRGATLPGARLRRALAHLLAHHDALRLRLTATDGSWQQRLESPGQEEIFTEVELGGLVPEARDRALEALAEAAQRSLDLAAGPLTRALLVRRGEGLGDRLLWVTHHLAVDGVSWRLLVSDLELVCGQLERREVVDLPPRTTSFQAWAAGLAARAADGTFDGQGEFWTTRTSSASSGYGKPVPEDGEGAEADGVVDDLVAHSRTLEVNLSGQRTEELLRLVPEAYRAQADEALLAALVLTLRRAHGVEGVLLELEGHGRHQELVPGSDLSRTVGWFTSTFPVVLESGPVDEVGAVLRRIKEQLRAVPDGGVGWGALRWLADSSAAAASVAEAASQQPQIRFNYLGRLDQAVPEAARFALASEPVGQVADPRARRQHPLEIDAAVADGRLRLVCHYSPRRQTERTVCHLLKRFVGVVEELLDHCASPEAGGYTPSDFPLAQIDTDALDRVLGADRGVLDLYPLSSTQQGILFQHLYEPESGVYFEQMICTLGGTLQVAAFQQAWQQVLALHPVLRTAFLWQGLDQPLQAVRSHVEVPWELVDWRHLEADEQESRFAARLAADRQRGFDPARAPLMDCFLARLGEGRWRFLWNHHHLLLDGWSLPRVLQDLAAAYQTLVVSAGASVASSSVSSSAGRGLERSSFRQYLVWLAEQDRGPAEIWWRQQLAGFHEPVHLGIDAGPPSSGVGAAAILRRTAPPALVESLEACTRQLRLTLSTVLQGAWALLLSRWGETADVVFGATVSGRPAVLPGVEEIVGVLINTLPVRVLVAEDRAVGPWLLELQKRQAERLEHQHVPLVEIQEWSDLPAGVALFDSLLVFENFPLVESLFELPGLTLEELRFVEQTHYPLTLTAAPHDGLRLVLQYDSQRFEGPMMERLLDHFLHLLEGFATAPAEQRLAAVSGLSRAARRQVLEAWNNTAQPFEATTIHRLFERQAERTPQTLALVAGGESLDYGELNRRADLLAAHLRSLGAAPGTRVGVALERSAAMVVALLAVLKTGASYVPVDPEYPPERITLMLEDSGAQIVLTQGALPPAATEEVVALDLSMLDLAAAPSALSPKGDATSRPGAPGPEVDPDQLAYVIYTSGSTGRPKGVMVSHRNVVSFFVGMDARVGAEPPGVWLAVTSISFDISVLELLWSLCRGFTVLVQRHPAGLLSSGVETGTEGTARRVEKDLDWSLMYFAAAEREDTAPGQLYRLLFEGARFADRHGFKAVWTPERHFHAFGGPYPNPSVTGAALAAITEHLEVRSGSVVLPLHSPLRVAEEWSVVDNISGGRVGVSFASGWHADDFVLAPENYAERHRLMYEGIDTVRRLWRGEAITLKGGAGSEVAVRIHPRPVQAELPFWLTAAGNPATFREAGARGAHLLTHLLGQSLEQLEEKIKVYREAREEAGFDPATGIVSLMLHTFIGDDVEAVREIVRQPFKNYLRTSVGLIRNLASSLGMDVDAGLSEEDMDTLLEHAFARYFETSGLFGTPHSCLQMVERLQAAGVDDVACLIDFGVEEELALEGLEKLAELSRRARERRLEAAGEGLAEATLGAQVARFGVTHLQCTPSLASLLVADEGAAAALSQLQVMMVGGEALAPDLAAQLSRIGPSALLNMYGPTETTIWSSTATVFDRDRAYSGEVTLGQPIANATIYLLDGRLRPVPLGLAGELVIGGPGVVRGYSARPSLTAERLVPDAFGAEAGARLYRTGDRVRRREDGELEFLGRFDHQIKVRGVRIEPGEIEEELRRLEGVEQAVVLARGETGGDVRLVAWVVPGSESGASEAKAGRVKVSTTALEEALRQRLPPAMVPSAWMVIDELPLTPNGKLDRRALPAPTVAARAGGAQASRMAPRSPVEEAIAEIWSDLLKVEEVGVHDSFFDLGGHSLLATQVVSRLRDTLAADLPLRSLFDRPTVAGLAAAVEEASGGATNLPPIVPSPAGRPAPLSHAQERLWFLNQLAPGAVYNDHAAFTLHGPLKVEALSRALAEIVRRHQVLRSRFGLDEGGQPAAWVVNGVELALPVVDLGGLAAPRRRAQWLALAQGEIGRTFDLEAGSLMRALLLTDGDREHALCLTVHHIVIDGWAWQRLFGELGTLYDAFAADQPSPLAEPVLHYGDFARWQRQTLTEQALEAQMEVWRRRLQAPLPVLELPSDRPRPAAQTYRGALRRWRLPQAAAAALRDLGRKRRVSLFMTLLTAFTVFLHRLVGSSDLLIGTPVANRGRREVEDMLGVFVNTLVLRVDLADRPSFAALLDRVRGVCLEAYANQDVPFERLVGELSPDRDLSHTPLFQVVFVVQNEPPPVSLPGLQVEPLAVDPGVAKFDLTVVVAERGEEGFDGWLEYNCDLFDGTTVERFARGFATLLEAVPTSLERSVRDLPLLRASEHHALLVEWRGKEDHVSVRAGLFERFAESVQRAPDAVAVSGVGGSLSYRQLEARALHLAHHLVALGVGPEVPAAIYLDRGLDTVEAILAVLAAGGYYVPLDPAYPADRVEFVLRDAAAAVLITRSDLVSGVPQGAAPLLLVDDHPAASGTPSRLAVAPAHAAYAIYTSGSTGQPKGVVVSHRNACRLFDTTARDFAFGAGDVWTLYHSTAFDFSVWELWGALLYGGRLVVVPRDVGRAPDAFRDLLAAERVTVLNQTPSAFRSLAEEVLASPRRDLALRFVIFGGEALDLGSLAPWFDRFGDRRPQLINMYGITETTVHVTYRPVREADLVGVAGSLIGGPLRDLAAYVVDAGLHPVPVGSGGELLVGGGGVARGYLGRPALTAQRFVPDPFAAEPGERLYRSGDLVRFRPDGELDYLGRIDYQVKIRGFRIELGEIETALGQLPQVHQAVVAARPGAGGTDRLVAWVVPVNAATEEGLEEALRSALRTRLPDYMVPAVFVVLADLPTTPSGKLDRRALPMPEAIERDGGGGDLIAPRGAVEGRLAEVWQRVLGVDQVGMHDNFFALGGDSILILQVVSRAREAGLRLTPRELFQHQTIAELATVADSVDLGGEEGPALGMVVLTPIQRWFFERGFGDPQHFNLALLLELRVGSDAELLARSLHHLVRRHDALRLRFEHHEGEWHQEIVAEGTAPLSEVDLTTLSSTLAGRALEAAVASVQRGLDLGRGPLLRALLLRLPGAGGDRLLLACHHLAVDGVSWRILVEDLERVYEQLAGRQREDGQQEDGQQEDGQQEDGAEISLPPRSSSFQRWAGRLAEHAASGAVDGELEHWLTLAKATAVDLPRDLPGANTVASTSTVERWFDAADTEVLLRGVDEGLRARTEEVLMAGLALTLCRRYRAPALLVDLEGHGRDGLFDDLDLSRTVGWFTALYPVLLEVGAADEPVEALKRVKESLRRVPGRGVSYGILRYLRRDGSTADRLRALPRASLLFNYWGQIDRGVESAGLLRPAAEPVTSLVSPRAERSHDLEVSLSVEQGRLKMVWMYSCNLHRVSTIEAWADGFVEVLKKLVASTQSAEVSAATPSDFPLLGMNQRQLDRLVGKVKGRRKKR